MDHSSYPFIYLASPHSHPSPSVRHWRYVAVSIAAAHYIAKDQPVYAPISHSSPIAEFGFADKEHDEIKWEYWAHLDITMIHHASELVVLTLPGWRESTGVNAEIAEAQRIRGMRISFVAPAMVIPRWDLTLYYACGGSDDVHYYDTYDVRRGIGNVETEVSEQ